MKSHFRGDSCHGTSICLYNLFFGKTANNKKMSRVSIEKNILWENKRLIKLNFQKMCHAIQVKMVPKKVNMVLADFPSSPCTKSLKASSHEK